MGREIRRVPTNWEHPKRDSGQYRPLMQADFKNRYKEWENDLREWYAEFEDFEKGKPFSEFSKDKGDTYEDFAGRPPSPPNPYDYMPIGDWFQLFEDVSEGTPISPPFLTEQELIDWLINNNDYWGGKWTPEAAGWIVKNGFALSGAMAGGRIYRPEEQYLIDTK